MMKDQANSDVKSKRFMSADLGETDVEFACISCILTYFYIFISNF